MRKAQQATTHQLRVGYRPDIPDIEYELSHIDDVQTNLRMGSSEANADLSDDYINVEVDELAQRRHYIKGLKDDVKQALAGRAGVRNHHVSDKLKDLPKGLVETYTTNLNRNIREEEREEARFLLLNMVAAYRPLKRKEIAAAFALWKKGTVLPNESLEDYTYICSSYGSIIYVANTDDDATVNFCHQSAKDFLLNNHGGSSEVWFHTSLGGANLLMFEMC
ncbi:hypothetical protein EMCG_01754 [[Emmonsia] crescens]|uniref:Uncharacterized protein n=1 Tax=[Emmonsia] crescens TaxID=73230 RepID=A0A0G2I0R4_9EURO|nr:hypothetical protein EMCG_01754 [Emmonsia crescens UAMH 3008]